MMKFRQDDTRVFPPLPPDSPLRVEWSVDGEYAPDHAIYTLRPWPSAERADRDLVNYIADKGDPDWPEVEPDTDLKKFERWLGDESWTKSWALAVRGANTDIGVSLAFPLLIFKNVQDPLGGGWFVNRIYFQGAELEDFGWLINYSPSASRWLDGYFAVGMEWDYRVVDGVGSTKRYTVTESGIKFRFDLRRTPLKFMRKLGTSFWGFRVGFQFRGVWSFDSKGHASPTKDGDSGEGGLSTLTSCPGRVGAEVAHAVVRAQPDCYNVPHMLQSRSWLERSHNASSATTPAPFFARFRPGGL
jgi:hypothetical protein